MKTSLRPLQRSREPAGQGRAIYQAGEALPL